MITEKMNTSLRQAYKELLDAENELNRPLEDVVTLSACQSVRSAMSQMLQTYLAAFGQAPQPLACLSDLMEACKKISRDFEGVYIADIACKDIDHTHCDGKYCLSLEHVSGCIAAANKIKDIVWHEFNLN